MKLVKIMSITKLKVLYQIKKFTKHVRPIFFVQILRYSYSSLSMFLTSCDQPKKIILKFFWKHSNLNKSHRIDFNEIRKSNDLIFRWLEKTLTDKILTDRHENLDKRRHVHIKRDAWRCCAFLSYVLFLFFRLFKNKY